MCADALRQAKDWVGLEKLIAVLEEIGDRTPHYYIANGALQQARKRTDVAVEWFAAGIELWPKDGTLRAEHLLALDSIGRSAEASAAAREALGNPPLTPGGYMELLMALDHTKHGAEYLAMLAKAKEAFPARQEWTMCDALQAMERGDFDLALELGDKLDESYSDTTALIKRSAGMMRGMKSFLDKLKGKKE